MARASRPRPPADDWSRLPAPEDDGGAAHLEGKRLPDIALAATDGDWVSLARLPGRRVVYAYPRISMPGEAPLVDDWDMIPGAKGCTPQSCAFRDHYVELKSLGVESLFGLSVQDTERQREAIARLHLPFELLSDARGQLTTAMGLPTMQAGGATLLRRLTMIIDGGRISKVFYPVFPPDRNAADVLAWLALRI